MAENNIDMAKSIEYSPHLQHPRIAVWTKLQTNRANGFNSDY
jgi:hypothetical protein